MGADNPGWVPPEAGAGRALPAVLKLVDQARARKHGTDLGNRLTDQAFGLLGRDAILTVIGLQNAVYDEGFWSRVDAWAGQLGPTGPAGIVQASGVPGAG